VKFSVRQILASAVGAVIAAVIASTFGVKGTIIGVAIGSAAATFGTALVAQSIERGQQAVKQVVVRAPDSSTLLRKLGSTVATGEAESSEDVASPSTASGEETDRLEISGAGGAPAGAPAGAAPATERIEATTLPMQPAGPTRDRRPGAARSFSWQTMAGTAAIVFVIALMFITAIELISGQPLSAIFGNHGTGTSVQHIFTPSPSPSPSPTTTTTRAPTSTTSTTAPTTTSTTTSTSTTATSTTTTTRPPAGTSTTTTTRPSTTTTATRVGGTTTSSAG